MGVSVARCSFLICKGKDSSNYSAEDMGCILGTKSEKVGAKARAVVEEAKGVDEEEDTGKFKQASGSYQDYFAAKMAALKAQGRFKEVPDWKEEAAFGAGQTLGPGAGNGRVVDREIQRESLLCPDYLKAAKGQRGSEEREAKDHEGEQVGEGEESVARKRKRQKVDPCTEEVREEVDHMEEGEGEVKKSKKRKKDKKERSPAADEDALVPDSTENLEPSEKKKKKKKNRKEREADNESSAPTLGEDDEEENLKKATEEPTEEHKEENSGAESKKSKKKKKKDSVAETNNENMVSMDTLSEDQVLSASQADCVEEKQKKKKSKKSKKEKSSDEVKEAVEDSGCEEVAEVKVKKTKKSKKEKTKSDEGADSSPKVKNDASKEESEANAVELEVESPAVGEEVESYDVAKKKKKKSKKGKAVEEEGPIVPAVADNVLKKNYPEAPGVLKGSNLLAIPGYGAPK